MIYSKKLVKIDSKYDIEDIIEERLKEFREMYPESDLKIGFFEYNHADWRQFHLFDNYESGHDFKDYVLCDSGELTEIMDEEGIPYELVDCVERDVLLRNPYVSGANEFYVTTKYYAKLHKVGDLI